MSQADTKQRILDAAEELFARNGFHGTSLRTITGKAGVNLAAVNYHFGSKEALIEAVFERRLTPLNSLRMERLEAVRQRAERESSAPDVRRTLLAFIEPTMMFREAGEGSRNFIVLVGRVLAEPDETVRMMFVEQIRPVFLFLFEILCRALPGQNRELLFWRLQFALGAISHTLCWMGRFPALAQGLEPPQDAATLTDWLLDFITAGMENKG